MNLFSLRSLLFVLLLALPTTLFAQMGFNSGAGVTPKRDLEMYTRNGFLVQPKYSVTTADPNASVNTMSCVSSPALTAFAGILKDPAGDSPYTAGVQYSCSATISIPTANTANRPLAIEFTFSQLDTEPGFDIVSIEGNVGSYNFSGSTIPPTFVYPASTAIVRFTTYNTTNVGQGFRLQWRSLIIDPGAFTPINQQPVGYGVYFQPVSAVFRAGFIDASDSQDMGFGSSALGFGNKATGDYTGTMGADNEALGNSAMALGFGNEARKNYAVAMGYENENYGVSAITMGSSNTVGSANSSVASSAENSVALGGQNLVTGDYSVALGNRNRVTQVQSTAIGYDNRVTVNNSLALGTSNLADAGNAVAIGTSTSAIGPRSVALGNNVSTNHVGAFTFGDFSTSTATPSTAQNQYTARFAGGYRLFSNSATTIGVQLTAGGNAWSAISDSTKKERFLPLNHADLLTNIRTLRLGTWNYKGQRTERHYGPMAQDFFARFGHDALGVIGCDTLINSHDFTAVTLSGVQALALENEQLKAATRLEALERAVLIRSAPRTSLAIRRKRPR
jgi:hypothetical protein